MTWLLEDADEVSSHQSALEALERLQAEHPHMVEWSLRPECNGRRSVCAVSLVGGVRSHRVWMLRKAS